MCPNVTQVTDVLEDAGYPEQVSGGIVSPTEGNMQLLDESDQICRGGTMSWPYVSDKPVSEYDKYANLKIISMAILWRSW